MNENLSFWDRDEVIENQITREIEQTAKQMCV